LLFHPQIICQTACFQRLWSFTTSRDTKQSLLQVSYSQTFNMAQPLQGAKKRFTWSNEPGDDPTPPQRAATFPAPPRGWVLETVSAYNLKWSRLRRWLANNFKEQGSEFRERQTMDNDTFLFYVPRRLREHELSAIDTLRETSRADQERHQDRRRKTPDPSTPTFEYTIPS
ncbi:hypothetical protein CT0861_07795, partial [Colletotrichum tofieldiae]